MDEVVLSFESFMCFTLLYFAHSDLDYNEYERKRLQHMFGNQMLKEMEALFDTKTDYQSLDIIMRHKPFYYATEENRQKLLMEMHKIGEADGNFSEIEGQVKTFLDRLL